MTLAHLDDLALLIEIVDAGSLAAAARRGRLPKSSVSRRLAAMEKRLGTALLQRNTRQMRLTEAGRNLYERCRPLVADMLAAEAELFTEVAEPRGTLRITATGAFGRLYVAPLLGEFLARHPNINAELLVFDRTVNMIEEGFDVAIRMGTVTDSGLVSRKLTSIERVLCASPAYLARAETVHRLADLKTADCLRTVSGNLWTFREAARIVTIDAKGRLASNQLEILCSAALQGCGIALLPKFLVRDDLETERLIEILPGTPPTEGAAYALWPRNRSMPSHSRSFIDFLAARLAQPGVFDAPLIPAKASKRTR